MKGNEPSDANYDEAARIPDHVFMDAHASSVSVDSFGQEVYEAYGQEVYDGYLRRFAAKVVEVQNTLELLHGHGPAEVEWETDFRAIPSEGRVYMPFKEGCGICESVHRLSKLREDNDG